MQCASFAEGKRGIALIALLRIRIKVNLSRKNLLPIM